MQWIAEFASDNGLVFAVFGLIALILGAVTIAIRFDLNEWLMQREHSLSEKIPLICTHTSLTQNIFSGRFRGNSLFFNPPESPYWICSRCQLDTLDPRVPIETSSYWVSNPSGWEKREKRLDEIMNKKLGLK